MDKRYGFGSYAKSCVSAIELLPTQRGIEIGHKDKKALDLGRAEQCSTQNSLTRLSTAGLIPFSRLDESHTAISYTQQRQ